MILYIDACMREESRTRVLAKEVLAHLNGEIETLSLAQENILPMTPESLAIRDHATHSFEWEHPMLRYAHQFAAADEIVIAAPYWDLAFPAMLRAYFEAICVSGITFKYVDSIPRSLCHAKRLIYVTTSGGPVFADFGFSYIDTLSKAFFGIPETVMFRAENLDVIGLNVQAELSKAKLEIESYFKK